MWWLFSFGLRRRRPRFDLAVSLSFNVLTFNTATSSPRIVPSTTHYQLLSSNDVTAVVMTGLLRPAVSLAHPTVPIWSSIVTIHHNNGGRAVLVVSSLFIPKIQKPAQHALHSELQPSRPPLCWIDGLLTNNYCCLLHDDDGGWDGVLVNILLLVNINQMNRQVHCRATTPKAKGVLRGIGVIQSTVSCCLLDDAMDGEWRKVYSFRVVRRQPS